MSENEILKLVKDIKSFADMHLYNTPSDVKNLHEIQYSFILTSNETEVNYHYSTLISSVEGAAIIISLITKEDINSVLHWVRNSKLTNPNILYLHCEAGRKITT